MMQEYELPAQHHDQRCEKKTPGVEIAYEKQRCKHHKMTPVENAAVYTAFVFDDKTLERTPQHYTNKVADIEKGGYHDQLFFL